MHNSKHCYTSHFNQNLFDMNEMLGGESINVPGRPVEDAGHLGGVALLALAPDHREESLRCLNISSTR